MNAKGILFLFFLLFSYHVNAKLVSGPMLGHTEQDKARIWFLLKKTQNFELILNNNEIIPYTIIGEDKVGHYWSIVVEIKGLKQAQSYTLSIKSNQKTLTKTPFVFTSYNPNESTRILVGSCAYSPPKALRWMSPSKQFIYNSMRKDSAKTMLWTGDNQYFLKRDYFSHPLKFKRFVKQRTHVKIDRFLKNGWQHYAVWDDHDFGPNDCTGDYPLKASSLKLHQAFWPNASYGLPNDSGIYTSFSKPNADFFLTDGRYHKTKPSDENPTMLGKTQLTWLFESLKKSKAAFKFIVVGSQFVNNKSKNDAFHHFPEEQKKIMDFIKQNRIEGVVFLSGDKHYSDLLKMPVENAYPLYDFTCSPLTSYAIYTDPYLDEPWRVPGTLLKDQNYGSVEVVKKNDAYECILSVFNQKGKLVWEHKITQTELSFKK